MRWNSGSGGRFPELGFAAVASSFFAPAATVDIVRGESGRGSARRFRLHTIADLANGLDVFGRRAELPSEAEYLHIDRPIGDRVAGTMEAIENVAARKGVPRPVGQEKKQTEFGAC